jgi:hypothetical protein
VYAFHFYVCSGLASFGHSEFRMLSVVIESNLLKEVDDVCTIITSLFSLKVIFKITALWLL